MAVSDFNDVKPGLRICCSHFVVVVSCFVFIVGVVVVVVVFSFICILFRTL